jgi:hypothetical protein
MGCIIFVVMKIQEIKDAMISILETKKDEIAITDFPELIPDIKGEYAIYMSVKEGYNPNVLWLLSVSQDFIIAFNQLLIDEKKIDWRPCHLYEYLFVGSPIYTNLKPATKRLMKGKSECWMPIFIKKA